MIMLAVTPPWIAVLSFDLPCAAPVLPIAIGRPPSSPSIASQQAFNARRQTDRQRRNPHSV
jgi:hypothetical protein